MVRFIAQAVLTHPGATPDWTWGAQQDAQMPRPPEYREHARPQSPDSKFKFSPKAEPKSELMLSKAPETQNLQQSVREELSSSPLSPLHSVDPVLANDIRGKAKKDDPITFNDVVGRTFSIPWHYAKQWKVC